MDNLKQYTILVVDDEETLRDAMVFDFKRNGFSVLSAENGVNAFELVKANKVHLVVSDMRMPGGDGMSLLEQLRAHDPEIPTVIFVTGFADVTEEAAIAKGAKNVLAKPFDRKVLMNLVLETLGVSMPAKAA